MKISNRPFILLEVFLAISILALTLIPLSTFPYKAAKKERELLTQIECERIFGLAHAHLFTLLETSQEIPSCVDLGNYEGDLSSLGTISLQASANIHLIKEKLPYQLFAIELSLKQKQFPDQLKQFHYTHKKT